MPNFTAMLQKQNESQKLELTVEQKVKENEELTAICDELISKVGDLTGAVRSLLSNKDITN